MLEIVGTVFGDPVDIAEPLVPRLGILSPATAQGLELVVWLLRLASPLPSLLLLSSRGEPLRKVRRVPTLQPCGPRILGIVTDYLIGRV